MNVKVKSREVSSQRGEQLENKQQNPLSDMGRLDGGPLLPSLATKEKDVTVCFLIKTHAPLQRCSAMLTNTGYLPHPPELIRPLTVYALHQTIYQYPHSKHLKKITEEKQSMSDFLAQNVNISKCYIFILKTGIFAGIWGDKAEKVDSARVPPPDTHPSSRAAAADPPILIDGVHAIVTSTPFAMLQNRSLGPVEVDNPVRLGHHWYISIEP
ncbi:hypothetical protein JOQ06_000588 [Pogonophryne albipinna]|uniref:Uncharacterized protein n=1 Tax=Pogonophryne albipinna TaxID=1090488 RepID=A0AAD6AFU0_9TELE|nr:hypothetical protein JOQ06_000588 [Pogonophryne albipinna]